MPRWRAGDGQARIQARSLLVKANDTVVYSRLTRPELAMPGITRCSPHDPVALLRQIQAAGNPMRPGPGLPSARVLRPSLTDCSSTGATAAFQRANFGDTPGCAFSSTLDFGDKTVVTGTKNRGVGGKLRPHEP